MDLVHLWIFLVGLVIILYVVLDGFSLGVGLLFPFAESEEERDEMMASIAPVWDANQTWIVFGGGALFASFPKIYTVLFSALYVPLFTFLFGLIFRGVAFEFRAGTTNKTKWNRAFFGGCLVATIGQGLTLGAYISGIKTDEHGFAGGAFDWLSPFSVMVAVALVAGYMLLGATYLLIKTTGSVRERAFGQAFKAVIAVAFFMIVVSVWTPHKDPGIWIRWFSEPRVYWVWTFPLLGIISFIMLLAHLKNRQESTPFFFSILLFLSAYLGLQSAVYPYAILPDVTIYEAAAQPETLVFILWGVVLVLPVVLAYTVYSYWVFRGKVSPEESYH